jgi:hypothetical protein
MFEFSAIFVDQALQFGWLEININYLLVDMPIKVYEYANDDGIK